MILYNGIPIASNMTSDLEIQTQPNTKQRPIVKIKPVNTTTLKPVTTSKPSIKPILKISPKNIINSADPSPIPVKLKLEKEEQEKDPDVSVDIDTYITPVYGVNMRVSLDNKYIYDMDFNLVGTVIDNKSIQWIE
jgi:hypothetical protein